MTENVQNESDNLDFATLLDDYLDTNTKLEGKVVKGRVLAIEGGNVLLDVGLKSEGRIPEEEFIVDGEKLKLEVGQEVNVFVEKIEDRHHEIVLSFEKARREAAWEELEKAYNDSEKVSGTVIGRVKGGFTVDLGGAIAFCPGSQIDIRPIQDFTNLFGVPQPFLIVKIDRKRNNLVVSRRAILEENAGDNVIRSFKDLQEGQVVEGSVKNITDYGAFIDLGGIDGLLHVTDITWGRLNHPSDMLEIGKRVKVMVTRFNRDTQRVSLGMKQLEEDPWKGVNNRYAVGQKVSGKITNVTDYGAFIELESGLEGLVHVSEMSWTKKNVNPSTLVELGQEVNAVVLDVDETKHRLSLGLKQCESNPWEEFAANNPVGTEVEGEVKNITEFGLFVGMKEGIDAMVHLSDLSWEKSGDEALKDFQKGQVVKAVVRDVDVEKERISLSIRHLSEDPFKATRDNNKKGNVVTCTITEITDNGLEVELASGGQGFIKKIDLARDRSEQRTDRFAVGEKIDAKVMNMDNQSRKVMLSVKAREIQEEREAMANYGSASSGASLGDILGAAMKEANVDVPADKATSKKKEEK